MLPKHLYRTLAAGAIAVAPTLAAAPAHADDNSFTLSAPAEADVWPYPAQQPHTTEARVEIGTTSLRELTNFSITFDTTDLAGIATVTPLGSAIPTDNCSTEGTLITCRDAEFFNHEPAVFRLTTAPDAHPGATGRLYVSVSADGIASKSIDLPVKVFREPTLLVDPIPTAEGAKPGTTVTPEVTVTNFGSEPADRVVVELSLVHGLTLAKRFSNCEYSRFPNGTPAATDNPDQQDVICTIHQTFDSGRSYRVDLGDLGLTQDALDPWANVATAMAEDDTAKSWRSRSGFQPGSGSTLTATEVDHHEPSPSKADSHARLQVLADSDTKFSSTAVWKPTDSTGLRGTLSVTFRNDGPGSYVDAFPDQTVESVNGDVHFLLPKGGRVVALPANCRAGFTMPEAERPPEDVACGADKRWIPNGYSESFELGIELPDGAQGSPLEIHSGWNTAGWGGVKHDFTTTINLDGSASSGSPSPGSTATGASGSAEDTAPETPLASTGASGIGTLTALGLGAVALGGGVLYLTTRRRRAGAHR